MSPVVVPAPASTRAPARRFPQIDPDRFARLWDDVTYRTIASDTLGLVRIETVWLGVDFGRADQSGLYETTVTLCDVAIERRTSRTVVEARETHERAVLVRRHRIRHARTLPAELLV